MPEYSELSRERCGSHEAYVAIIRRTHFLLNETSASVVIRPEVLRRRIMNGHDPVRLQKWRPAIVRLAHTLLRLVPVQKDQVHRTVPSLSNIGSTPLMDLDPIGERSEERR